MDPLLLSLHLSTHLLSITPAMPFLREYLRSDVFASRADAIVSLAGTRQGKKRERERASEWVRAGERKRKTERERHATPYCTKPHATTPCTSLPDATPDKTTSIATKVGQMRSTAHPATVRYATTILPPTAERCASNRRPGCTPVVSQALACSRWLRPHLPLPALAEAVRWIRDGPFIWRR